MVYSTFILTFQYDQDVYFLIIIKHLMKTSDDAVWTDNPQLGLSEAINMREAGFRL